MKKRRFDETYGLRVLSAVILARPETYLPLRLVCKSLDSLPGAKVACRTVFHALEDRITAVVRRSIDYDRIINTVAMTRREYVNLHLLQYKVHGDGRRLRNEWSELTSSLYLSFSDGANVTPGSPNIFMNFYDNFILAFDKQAKARLAFERCRDLMHERFFVANNDGFVVKCEVPHDTQILRHHLTRWKDAKRELHSLVRASCPCMRDTLDDVCGRFPWVVDSDTES